jgi:drug/metabolite transporter (DMT)-like permease
MTYLFLTILCTSALFILFRLYSNLKIDIFQSIVWNYITCSITGLLHQYSTLTEVHYGRHMDTVVAASLLGSCFLPCFFLIGTSTQHAGLTPTTMANKLSMIIPAGFAIIAGMAPFSWLQVMAFVLGIVAVYFATQKTAETSIDMVKPNRYLPWFVFLSAGLLDLAILYINRHIATPESAGLFSLHTFTAAAWWGILILLFLLLLKKITFHPKAILSGIALGIPNYFSVYYLLQTLNYFQHDGSFVFPMLNLSIILFTALISYLFFKEKFTATLILGLALASTSILLLYLIKA